MFYGDVGLYQDLLIPVTNFTNEDKGFMVLAGDVFDLPIRKDIIHRVVRWQLAKRQQVVTVHNAFKSKACFYVIYMLYWESFIIELGVNTD